MLNHLRYAVLLLAALPAVAAGPAREIAQTETPVTSTPNDEEKPPPPEPPYPGSETGAFAADPTSAPKKESEPQPERPRKIDEEDVYHYGTAPAPFELRNPSGVEQPKKVSEHGEFVYDTAPAAAPAPIPPNPGVERPEGVSTTGMYQFRVEHTQPRASASFRFSGMTPPSITNADNGFTFANIYGDSPLPTLLIDREWRLTSTIGRLGVKFGSGLAVTNAQGRFRSNTRANEKPEERFTFVLLPNQLTAIYKFQYADNQVLVPFIEGGGGYFLIAEVRDDAKKVRYAGVPVAVAAGGVNFLLNWMDPQAVRNLENDYGINHVWLTAEVRQFMNSGTAVSFNSTSVGAGFLMEF